MLLDLTEAIDYVKNKLQIEGDEIKTETWQGINSPDSFIEILNINFSAPIPLNKEELQLQTKASQPWSENHFFERVSGLPLNPGEQYKHWPHYRKDPLWKNSEDKFSHTYMERFWPDNSLRGIRFNYGNLNDVIALLLREPFTRQAYLPIWFPEDTGVKFGGRVPCTLGYHFIRRGNKLHIFYPIRSCDFIRHFKNDIYLAGRLVQWLIEQLKLEDKNWGSVVPGNLSMHIVSMHLFKKEKFLLTYI